MDEWFYSIEGSDINMDTAESVVNCEATESEKELYFDSETPWIGAERNSTPWWRTVDTNELASFVAKRSLNHIENCDLPRPQITRVNKKGVDFITFYGSDRPRTLKSGHSVSSAVEPLSKDISSHESVPETHHVINPTKTQLMEALHHSQTRAREAERAAEQARADKEDVVKLVFRQASHLFAYKQWLQLLQLENMCLQTRYNSSFHRKQRASCEQGVGIYTVVFALGLGFVGAGFLVGWTTRWFFRPGEYTFCSSTKL